MRMINEVIEKTCMLKGPEALLITMEGENEA